MEYELLVYINPLEDKTKLKGGALNYRVDQSVVKYVGFRNMERGCFPQKNRCPAKGEYQPKRKEPPAPLTRSLLQGVVYSYLAQRLNLQLLPLQLVPEALVAQYVLIKSTTMNGLVISFLILYSKFVCNLCMCH